MRVPAAVAAVPLLSGSAAGVFLSQTTPPEYAFASAAAALLALIAGCAFLADRLDAAVVACIALGCALAGFSMGASDEASRASRIRQVPAQALSPDADPVVVEGVLVEDGAMTGYGASLLIDARRITFEGDSRPVRAGVRLTVGGAVPGPAVLEWRAGRTIRTPVLLRPPAAFRNPGMADDRSASARRGVALVGSVKSASLVEVVRTGGPVEESAASARAWVRSVIGEHVGRLNRTSSAISLSILIGDRTGLSDADERRLQDAGTYHVIAISGGNIAIFTALLVFAGRLFRVPYRLSAVLTILVLLAYGQIAGGSPSVSRAVAAAIVFLMAAVVDHRGAALNTVAIAALFGAAAMPAAVVDAGFLLSFGATAGIILGARRLAEAMVSSSRRAILRPFGAMLAATLAADLVIAPIAASYFSRVTAAGLAVNFAAIPLMTVVQVGSMALLAASIFSPVLTHAASRVVHLSAYGLLESSSLVELCPWMARDVPAPAWWFCALYYAALAAALMRATRLRIGLCAVSVALLVTGLPVTSTGLADPPGPGRLRVVVLDVGQGDATVVQLPNGSALLVDAGGLAGTTFDIGGRIVVPAMRALRVDRMHAFVITHADPDHLGGAEAVLRTFRPRNVWEGVPVPPHPVLKSLLQRARQDGIIWRTVRPGDIERAGEVRIRVLHPPPPDWERQRVRNDDSVVIELRYHDVSILLPGDVGAEVERQLVPALEPAHLVILKAAHHGSTTSSSDAFLDATKPAAVIFSAGKNNRFGHPARLVLERFSRRGVEMFNTAHDGAVFVETDGKVAEVSGWTGRRVTLKAH